MTSYLRLIATVLLLALAMPAQADDEYGPTPPRLSYFKGDVAVYREQGDSWEEVRLNLPIAEGDALDTGAASSLELQLGSYAYIRADSHSRFQLAEQQPGSLRIEIDSGRVAFDLREMPGDNYLLDVSVHGVLFTLERPGYYRFDVNQDVRLSVRQGGQAIVIPAGGESLQLRSSETLWLPGSDAAHATVGRVNEPDAWDRWNLARTDDLLAASSTRYLPAGVAGAYELDRYGSWRITQTYGAVWMPYTVAPGWVPYGNGHWVWDPYYQWTWIDDAPWGWAPFHYGRWIYLGNRWVWAPGPLIRRPVYSPALVAFFYYGPLPAYRTCWVALGWGEPVVPWWGRPALHGKPSWHGWGGPKLVNRKPVPHKAEINAGSIVYTNSQVSNALVAAAPEQFGHKDMQKTHLSAKNRSTLTPWLGALPQRQEEHALRRAESKVPAVPRIGRPDPRGSTHFSVRKEEERPREPRLPHMQRMPGEPEKTLEVQLTTPETGSSGAREFAAQHRAKRPAAFGQPREPRQSYGQQDRQSSSREAAGAAGRESSARQERQLKIRSTPYGLDPEFRAPRTVPGAYPQGRQPGVRWDVGEQQGYGRNPESPAATQ